MKKLIELYNIARKHVPYSKFNIQRVKTANADNVPFEMLGSEYLYLVSIVNVNKDVITEYMPEIDMNIMQHLCTDAMLYGAEWNNGFPFFLEEFYSREWKWNPDYVQEYVYHWDLLLEEVGEDYRNDFDEENYIPLMDAYLSRPRPVAIEENPFNDMPF